MAVIQHFKDLYGSEIETSDKKFGWLNWRMHMVATTYEIKHSINILFMVRGIFYACSVGGKI